MPSAIYLSPHLDDAVLSCGGQIAQAVRAGNRVRVVTVFAGDVSADAADSAFVRELHARWGLGENPPALRRAEDVAALRTLGTDVTHLAFPDCVYRLGLMGAPLYPTRDAIFGGVAPVEMKLIERITVSLANLQLAEMQTEISNPQSPITIYLPLTAGHHVDHQIVRAAGERWAGRRRIAYYEDYPYAESPDQVRAALGEKTFRAKLVQLDESALVAKVAAIACYRSQLSTFFADEAEMAARVRTYAEATGGGRPAERLWRKEEA
jgi:LmbE family N-acetylglucosaminyl deacetylase